LPGYQVGIWFGVLAPAGTPQAIVNKLHQEIVAIFRSPDVSKTIVTQGGDVVASTPAEFGKVMRSETARLGKVIRDAGIKPE
jgi:tripartite-type tricarboxylate transporter receptor subunit TctC